LAEEFFDLSDIAPLEKPTAARNRTSMLIYGRHRVGKTTFVSEACEVDGMWPVLWLATEDGTGAFEGKYDEERVDVVHIKDTAQMINLVTTVVDNKTKYKTVVIDTAGQFQEIIKRDYKRNNPNAKNAFEVWDKIAEGLFFVTDLLHNSQYNFFLIAHTAKEKDEILQTVLLSPHFLGKKSVVEIPKIPDTIAYLEKLEDDEGKGFRLLHLTASGRIDAGSRYEHKLPDRMKDPKMKDYYEAITA
jgi:AAA domain